MSQSEADYGQANRDFMQAISSNMNYLLSGIESPSSFNENPLNLTIE
jgi:hypothetical protein